MLSKKDIQAIEAKQAEVLAPGTPEKGYTDSGFWKFLKYVYTKDEHDNANPVKRLVGDGDTYMIVVFLFMLACESLLIPKSRQIRMSWMCCAYAVWSAMKAPYRTVGYQAKKESDAYKQTTAGSKDPAKGRMDFIIQYLPSWLADPNIVSGKGNLAGILNFTPDKTSEDGVEIKWRGSSIFGFPQGANQVRQHTLSTYINDESAFQDEYRETMRAVGAAVTGGGQSISCSSIEAGSHFNEVVLNVEPWRRERIVGCKGMVPYEDVMIPEPLDMSIHEIPEAVQKGLDILGLEWPRGMRAWKTLSGAWALEVNLIADPKKDPLREGLEWYRKAVKKEGYGGNYESSDWQTEMNINYGAGGGDPVFPFLRPGCPVFVDGPRPHEWLKDGSRFFAGYDYGSQNPSAFEVIRVAPDGTWWSAWELYEPCTHMARHVEEIKKCPYWDRIEKVVCDPSIMAKTQQSAHGIKTLAELFMDHGLYLQRGRRDQDVSIAQMLRAGPWSDPEKPTFFLTKATPNLNSELMGLRWEQYTSAAVELRRNAPEKIRQKDNHAFDAITVLLDDGVEVPIITETRNLYGTWAQAVQDLRLEISRERQRSSGVYTP